MDLFKLLELCEVIVSYDGNSRQIITWNEANTFTIWQAVNSDFIEINKRVYKGTKILNFNLAKDYADRWLSDNRNAALGYDD